MKQTSIQHPASSTQKLQTSNNMTRILIVFISLVCFLPVKAGEGMWIPLLLDSLNAGDMQAKGLRLSAEQIYSINQASLKDAVVIFGSGCTGELISSEGLLITNHHCGYSNIQSHSTVEKDYLTNGFWAGSKTEELPNPQLTVSFLVRIEDVTLKVLQGVADTLSEDARNQIVEDNITRIEREAIQGTHYLAEAKPFYFGREYYLFVYENFNDVRLVGAPPEAIGRFGGDTDNWMWPRHTGDFSLFRIYASKENKPAAYSPENVPFKSKKHLNISVDGIKEGDFTMVMGYPGRTDEYLYSGALEMITQKALPAKIKMRDLRLKALDAEMLKGHEERLRYAARYVSVSNSWKKWIGVTKGIERSDAIHMRKQVEEAFLKWSSDQRNYSHIIDDFEKIYSIYEPIYLSNDLGNELLNSLELTPLLSKLQPNINAVHDSSDNYKKNLLQTLKLNGRKFFKSGVIEIDRKILPRLLQIYAENISETYLPAFYTKIGKGSVSGYDSFVTDIFNSSVFTDSVRYYKFLRRSEDDMRRIITSDPLVNLYRDFSRLLMNQVYFQTDSLNLELNKIYRQYLSGLQKMNPDRILYPDANFTMRITYGKVEGYQSADAVDYLYYSTLDGIIEKENPEIADYKVPEKLRELYSSHDFGPYLENGKVPVCFIATNHTSGGNSGSPVMNANGDLIGINFDRNWEGTVSDYAYDPEVCRNISLDVRYVLYVIDKVANADWLLDELTIVNNR